MDRRSGDDEPVIGTLARAGRAEEARRLARLVLDRDPGQVAATDWLARLCLAAGDARGALQYLSATHDPDHPRLAWAWRETAQSLMDRGFWEDAAPLLARAAAREPWDAALAARHARVALPDYLAPTVTDPVTGGSLRRYAAREAPTYQFVIDVAGACNLRCPTCPVGNTPLGDRPTGLMRPDLFTRILARIVEQSPAPRTRIAFFNWGEPLLHPALPDFIRQTREAGLWSQISTTLNISRGLEAVVAAAPDEIKISLSGFTPETYARSHVRGDLATVRENMRLTRRYLDRYRVPTRVWVGHHLYRSNRHQAGEVRAFCEELGFAWHPIDAFYMPLERVLGVLEGRVSAKDDPILDDLPVPIAQRRERIAATRSGGYDCELRFNQTVINHDGTVALCCAVYEPANMLGVSFLDEPLAAIEARKYRHPFCATCRGAHLDYAPPEMPARPAPDPVRPASSGAREPVDAPREAECQPTT